MPFFRRKFRVKTLAGRGAGDEGDDMAHFDALKSILQENYATTKEDFDALDDDLKESFNAALGSLADAFA